MKTNIKDGLKKPELLAPAGNWTMLNTAIKSGANAVYFGVKQLNMRAAAGNFDLTDLPEIAKYCSASNIKTHLTLNTIVYENELAELDEIVKTAKNSGIDMIICWDMSVIQKCIEYKIPFCISTQASVSNSASVKFFEQIGASRIVLARECTLEKIQEIKKNSKIEIETFIHGAMCVAVSGRCFMSHDMFGKSANRGECLQPCRREFEIKDIDQKGTLILGEDYIMSPKDLCSIEFIDKIIEAGADSLKIEGRKRAPEYIAKVVSSYRKAIDSFFEGNLTDDLKQNLKEELNKVYNRGFSSGFYFGQPGKDDFAKIYGSAATTRKVYVGRVTNYYQKINVVQIKIEAEKLEVGDSIYFIGDTTGVVERQITSLLLDEKDVPVAEKGNEITFLCEERIRVHDKVYKVVNLDS